MASRRGECSRRARPAAYLSALSMSNLERLVSTREMAEGTRLLRTQPGAGAHQPNQSEISANNTKCLAYFAGNLICRNPSSWHMEGRGPS